MKKTEKRYYWLKLKEDFFDDKHIRYLRKMPDGDRLVIVYLRMQLYSLKTEGIIRYSQLLPSCVEELALSIDEDIEIVKFALAALGRIGLVEIWDDQTVYMAAMQDFVGNEGSSAERVRRHRERKALQCNDGTLHDVTKPSLCHGEIEINLEKELELEKKKDILPGAETAPDQHPSKKPNSTIAELPAAERVMIELPLNDGTRYAVIKRHVDRWAELYPAVDVMQQLRAMAGWCEANPSKKKTRRGVSKFINGWLSREQDKGGIGNAAYQQFNQTPGISAGNPGKDRPKYSTVLD